MTSGAWAFVAAAIILAACGSARAQQGPGQGMQATSVPTIAVQGFATEEIVPDTATVSVGVVTERPDARQAMADNAAAAQGLAEAVRAAGIEARRVRTVDAALEPVSEAPQPGRAAQRIASYRASNVVTIEVDPQKVGALVSALVGKGANRIDGIAFSSSREQERQEALEADAARQARRRAEAIAAALGVKLGPVLSVAPQGELPRPMMATMRLAKAAPGPTPVEGGMQTVEARVSVTFALEP